MMKSLSARIESARNALRAAETRLRGAVTATDVGDRAQKVEVSAAVRGALSRLRAAQAKLAHLESAFASRNVGAARTALQEAELELDLAIERIDVAVRSDKKWMTDVVEDAFEKLRGARATLAELEIAALEEG